MTKLKCWRRVGTRDEYIRKDGLQIVQVTPLNGKYQSQLGVSIRTKPNKQGMQSIKLEKYFGKFLYGNRDFREGQPSQKKANKFMQNYMKYNDKC
jgi:hypothetical protein